MTSSIEDVDGWAKATMEQYLASVKKSPRLVNIFRWKVSLLENPSDDGDWPFVSTTHSEVDAVFVTIDRHGTLSTGDCRQFHYNWNTEPYNHVRDWIENITNTISTIRSSSNIGCCMLLFGLPYPLPRYVFACLVGTLGCLFETELNIFEELASAEMLLQPSMTVLAARMGYYSVFADVVWSPALAANCSRGVPFVLAFTKDLEVDLWSRDMFFDVLGAHSSKSTSVVEWTRHPGARWVLTNVLEAPNSTAVVVEQATEEQIQQASLRRVVEGLGRSLAEYCNFWIDWIEVTRDYGAHNAARKNLSDTVLDRDLASRRNLLLGDLDQYRDACKLFRVWQRVTEGKHDCIPRPKDLEALRTDWGECFRKAERYEQALTTRLQTDAALLSVEESIKSIKEAESVGRLTQLAFIFVPLTFTTGVFGMNITPFGGHAPMWIFWITATLVSVGALVLWSMSERLGKLAGFLADFLRDFLRKLRGFLDLLIPLRQNVWRIKAVWPKARRRLQQRLNALAGRR
ncbi:hypothetical protein PV11_09466 [Exophiala sideris]|uniref:Uncharacterized protein n=1 Tax=Exophiala sideris TaxID=1016849 RepID=A0A0D1YRW3_9EURO|nr:hypothetical protein PV11_09466 [Exophiala sideris]